MNPWKRSGVRATRKAATATLAATLAAAAACASGEADRTEAIVRDSAGVRIVEHGDVSGHRAPFRLSAEPIWTVGRTPGGRELVDIGDGIVLPGGGAAITDYGDARLVLVSPDGEVTAALGGSGRGPGELGIPWSVHRLAGDTLAVQDATGNKLSRFHGGAFVADQTLPPDLSLRNRADAVDERGRFLLTTPSSFSPRFEGEWLRMPLLVLDPAAPSLDTVARYDFLRRSPEGPIDPLSDGFGRASAGPDGFVVVRGDRTEVRWVDASGALVQLARWTSSREPLTDSVWSAYESGYRARLGGRTDEALLDARLGEARAAAARILPVFSGAIGALLVDDEGRVWLPAWDADFRFVSRYRVLTSAGDWLGEVDMPRRAALLAATSEYGLVLERDAFDVQTVSLYAIENDGAR